jgi:hypothetical protein
MEHLQPTSNRHLYLHMLVHIRIHYSLPFQNTDLKKKMYLI